MSDREELPTVGRYDKHNRHTLRRPWIATCDRCGRRGQGMYQSHTTPDRHYCNNQETCDRRRSEGGK